MVSDTVMSLFCTVTIYAGGGFLAHERNVSFSDVFDEGEKYIPNLIFLSHLRLVSYIIRICVGLYSFSGSFSAYVCRPVMVGIIFHDAYYVGNFKPSKRYSTSICNYQPFGIVSV